jgi:hypothetical protein
MELYNTNLAAEFYVLSILHRLGADTTLTLGNKKSVYIAVVKSAGDTVTIAVKGLAERTSWSVDNIKTLKKSHFIVFIRFLGNISDPTLLPEIYVVPSNKLAPFVYHSPKGKRKVVGLHKMRREAKKYLNAWHLVL